MWWGSGRKGIAYVDCGTVGILKPGNGIASVSVCEEGNELELLATAISEVQAASWHVFLGPSLAEWRAMQRVANLWRRREREIAARALLSPSGDSPVFVNDSYTVCVADPAPQSRWVAYLIANETMLAAEGLVAEGKHRLRSIESFPGAVASELEHKTGSLHAVAMVCAREVAWIVKDRDAVIDCGVWRGPTEPETTFGDCRRLQLAHGIPNDRVLILKLRVDNLEALPFEAVRSDWRWRNTRLAALWSPMTVD